MEKIVGYFNLDFRHWRPPFWHLTLCFGCIVCSSSESGSNVVYFHQIFITDFHALIIILVLRHCYLTFRFIQKLFKMALIKKRKFCEDEDLVENVGVV